MSGMGGLFAANWLFSFLDESRAEKQRAITKRPLVIGKSLVPSQNYPRPVASMLQNMRHILLFGKTLRAFSTKHNSERFVWPRVTNSGMVITKKIGQPACLLPKGDMLVYGRASETERMWVNNEGLSNQSWLKIQSAPLGNLRVKACILQLRSLRCKTNNIVIN